MIDLSGVKDFNAARFLIYWLVAPRLVWEFQPARRPPFQDGLCHYGRYFHRGGYCVGAAYLYDSSGTRLSCVSLVFPY